MTARSQPDHDPLPPGLYTTRWARNNLHQPWHVWIPEDGGLPILCRKLTTELFEAIRDGLAPTEPNELDRPPLKLMESTIMAVDDVDALLAEAGTVREPSVSEVLRNTPYVNAWLRWDDWRNGPGHRAICPQCNCAFTRDLSHARRCSNCRRKFKRVCAGCGQQFSATHYLLRRCPPCRAEWLERPRGQLEQERRSCGRCGEPFVPRSWNAKYCRECQ